MPVLVQILLLVVAAARYHVGRLGQKLKRTVAADKTITRRPALLLASLQGRELVKSRRVVITGLLSG